MAYDHSPTINMDFESKTQANWSFVKCKAQIFCEEKLYLEKKYSYNEYLSGCEILLYLPNASNYNPSESRVVQNGYKDDIF